MQPGLAQSLIDVLSRVSMRLFGKKGLNLGAENISKFRFSLQQSVDGRGRNLRLSSMKISGQGGEGECAENGDMMHAVRGGKRGQEGPSFPCQSISITKPKK